MLILWAEVLWKQKDVPKKCGKLEMYWQEEQGEWSKKLVTMKLRKNGKQSRIF
jgi:hypothetical protein